MSSSVQSIIFDGRWVQSQATSTFQAVNPTTEEALLGLFPVSPWSEIDSILNVAAETSREMRGWPGSRFADFLVAVQGELDKVNWATWEYLIRATGVVLVTMVIASAFLWLCDFAWVNLFEFIGFLRATKA